MEVPDFTYQGLDNFGYRQLQKLAKSMGLPSNVKKVYLIEMMIAKRFSSPAELEVIINRVKLDRLKVSQNKWSKRKMILAQSEVTSTSRNSPLSPSITITPKRSNYVIQYSPDTTQTIIKYQPPKSYPAKKTKTCDRILRSYNTKTPRPDYAMMDDVAIYGSSSYNTKNSSFNTKIARTSYNTKMRDYTILNLASESNYNTKIVKKLVERRSSILDHGSSVLDQSGSVRKIMESKSSILNQRSFLDQDSSFLNQRSPVLDRNRSILDQSSSVTTYNAKIMNPKTEIRPANKIIKTRYGIMDRNDLINKVVRDQNTMRVKKAVPRLEVRRESLLNSSVRVFNREIQMQAVQPSTNTSSPIPAKRKRTISGIYPITTQENPYYECVQTVDYRHTDGKITKINALIQKPRHSYPTITVQDVINNKIDSQIFKTSNNESTEQITKAIEQKPTITATEVSNNTRQLSDLSEKENTQIANDYFDFSIQNTHNIRDFSTNCTERTLPTGRKIDFSTNNTQIGRQFLDSSSTPTYTNVMIKEMPDNGNFSVYYHKKIRSEQIRHRLNEQNEVLPHINEVFSQFNEAQYRELTQPLYIQVSQESERFPHCPIFANNRDSGSMLESIYNFKQELIVNEPLLKIATSTNTKCVFTANTVVSAEAHPSPMYRNDSSYAPVDLYNSNIEAETRLYDYMRGRYHRDFTCNEVLSPTNSSIGTTNSQELGVNVTIPEMVEDALELISQDGDYMERIGMDSRMQCIMCYCEWIGSQLVLEYHIRQVHQNDIIYKLSSEWSITLTLGSLTSNDTWLSHVVYYNEYFYIVSVKYIDDRIMVALTTLTETNQHPKRGKITIYNKISGKPYIWENEIPYIPDTMPYHCTENCLKIDIANLDLLPNSANLKLVNNELKSLGNKVVIGQPSLNDIEIITYIQVFD